MKGFATSTARRIEINNGQSIASIKQCIHKGLCRVDLHHVRFWSFFPPSPSSAYTDWSLCLKPQINLEINFRPRKSQTGNIHKREKKEAKRKGRLTLMVRRFGALGFEFLTPFWSEITTGSPIKATVKTGNPGCFHPFKLEAGTEEENPESPDELEQRKLSLSPETERAVFNEQAMSKRNQRAV